jgi:hypothetical protein
MSDGSASHGSSAGSRRKVRTMSKKLTLNVFGVLAALALTALPGAASAKETALKCEKTPCTFTVAGGATTISSVSGDTVSCTSVTGSGKAINLGNLETTTTEESFIYHGCKETTTIFKFACTTPGQPSGTITSNSMTGHIVALPGATNEAGILLTDVKTTFTCAGGFARTTITGYLIGEFETKCGTPAGTTRKLNFETVGHGAQKLTIYTGATFNLIDATNHNETPTATSGYETAAESWTGTINFNQSFQLTCSV